MHGIVHTSGSGLDLPINIRIIIRINYPTVALILQLIKLPKQLIQGLRQSVINGFRYLTFGNSGL